MFHKQLFFFGVMPLSTLLGPWGRVLWDMQYTQKASFINPSSSVEVITTCRGGSRGVGAGGWGFSNPPPPGIFKIYILENNISRFSALSGVFLYAHFK